MTDGEKTEKRQFVKQFDTVLSSNSAIGLGQGNRKEEGLCPKKCSFQNTTKSL